jgi:acyl carrier protein
MRSSMSAQIQEQVVAIVKPFVRNPEALASIGPETRLLEDLKINSARMVDIVLEFENVFGIEVGDDDAFAVRTVGDAVLLVSRLKA